MTKVKVQGYGREVEIESDDPSEAVLLAALNTWVSMESGPSGDGPTAPATYGFSAERASQTPATSTARRIYGPVR